MKKQHLYIILLVCLFSLTESLSAQIFRVDTLAEIVIMSDPFQQSAVYSVDSISDKDMSRSHSLTDALRRSQSLYIKEYGPGNISNVGLRGNAAQHTNVFWNGIPINSVTLGSNDISMIPTILIEDVSVLKGASSLLSGVGGLGGSILLSSARKTKKRSLQVGHRLSPILGDFETSATYTDVHRSFNYRISAFDRSADNRYDYVDDSSAKDLIRERVNSGMESQGASYDLVFSAKKEVDIALRGHYVNMEREIATPIGIPNRQEVQRDELFRTLIETNMNKGRMTHHAALGLVIEDQNYSNPFFSIESKIKSERYHARYQWGFQLSRKLLVRSRLDHDFSRVEIDEIERPDIVRSGLFMEIDYELEESCTINGGLRVQSNDRDLEPVTGSLGVKKDIRSVHGLYLSGTVSKNFRNPTVNDLYWPELGNPDLVPESGHAGDFRAIFNHERWNSSIGFFVNKLNELIIWKPGVDGLFRPVNLSESRNRGAECTIERTAFGLFRLELAYTYTKSEVRLNIEERWLESLYQPEHIVNSGLKAEWKGNEIGCNYSYASSFRSDYSENQIQSRLGPIELVELTYWKEIHGIGNKVFFGFELKNILNKNYEYIKDRPIPGRYVQLQFKILLNET